MKKGLIRIIAIGILSLASVTFNLTEANAEWVHSYGGWIYKQGDSCAQGWNQIDGKWYYFDSNIMQEGWISSSNPIDLLRGYYCNPVSGERVTGWKEIDGCLFYFYNDGKLAANIVIDGRKLSGSGATYNENAEMDESLYGTWKSDKGFTIRITEKDFMGEPYTVISNTENEVIIDAVFQETTHSLYKIKKVDSKTLEMRTYIGNYGWSDMSKNILKKIG